MSRTKIPKRELDILRCKNHSHMYAICLDGTRIAGYKCCGHWDTVKSWSVNADEFTKGKNNEE